MTEPDPTPDTEEFDFASLTADDAPPIEEPIKPDHTQSRRNRRFGMREPVGDKAESPRVPRSNAREPKRKPVPNRKGQFKEPLEQFYTGIGIALMPFDPVCANAVISAAPRCAETLDELAYRNESFRRIIFALVSTSAVGAVIAAHLPILLAIAMHHVPAVQNIIGIRSMEFAEATARNMQEHGEPDANAA